MANAIKLHVDIETGDPDDLWTLSMLTTHPEVDLQSVTVFPGGRDQIGLIKTVLSRLGRSDIPVGAIVRDDGKSRVSKYYNRWLGSIEDQEPDGNALDVIKDSIDNGATHLFTGGPLTNIGHAIDYVAKSPVSGDYVPSDFFSHWTCQGGFVGDNLVPEELRLDKFNGKLTVPTFNLNGNPKASLKLLSLGAFDNIYMVGKNVCHGFTVDKNSFQQIPKGKHAGLDLMIEGLEAYFKKKDVNKALHDNLAAVMMIKPELGTWVTGKPYREKGKWGFEAEEGSNIKALINVDRDKVFENF